MQTYHVIMEDQIKCGKCGSTQITAQKKGFSIGKAAAGAILTGGIGLAAGAIGSGKIIITCLNCGNQFKPGSQPQINTSSSTKFISAVPAGEPKLVWDDATKSHIQNPKYAASLNIDKSDKKALIILVCVIVGMILFIYAIS
jgi:ribosomal protein S27E